MTIERLKELKELCESELDRAEAIWRQSEEELTNFALNEALMSKKAQETLIPGYPFIEDGESKVDEFIALVVDIRNSTKHLNQAIRAKASGLERVLYETSALLPCASKILEWNEGAVTEYLGDGALGLFLAGQNRDKTIYAAYRAAKEIISEGREVINKALEARYELPPIDLGVGLAISKAVIMLVGGHYRQPKVFGKCVFQASKTAGAVNKIIVDEDLKGVWPKVKGGTIGFTATTVRGVNGFEIRRLVK